MGLLDGVSEVVAAQGVEQQRCLSHRACHGARRVEFVGDGDDAAAAEQAHGRLDADHTVQRRRADDRAGGFGADGQRGKTGGGGRCGAGT
ncbi:hypothetical protein D3C73_945840 [compost metagenome]